MANLCTTSRTTPDKERIKTSQERKSFIQCWNCFAHSRVLVSITQSKYKHGKKNIDFYGANELVMMLIAIITSKFSNGLKVSDKYLSSTSK